MKRQAVMLILALLVGSAYAAADTTPAPAAKAATSTEFTFSDQFATQIQRARDYEQAYAEQGKKSFPWLAKVKMVNERKFGDWLKKDSWNFPPVSTVADAPRIGGAQFKLTSIMATPLGWQMVLEPRDKKVAGFSEITITADQKDITGVEIK